MKLIKNTIVGKTKTKIKFLVLILLFNSFYFFFSQNVYSEDEKSISSKFLKIKILDKVSSKSSNVTLEMGKETEFKNLLIKSLKCINSKFDDSPEIIAYLQVKDKNKKNNDNVFVFNGWMFSSSPSIAPFDHPVYDIWLVNCR